MAQVPVFIIKSLKMTLFYFFYLFAIFHDMQIDLKEIGRRIEATIKSAGISRKDLGKILGVKEGAVGRHVRGETDPGIISLAKIAEIGNVTIDWLITGSEHSSQPKTPTREDALKEVAMAAYRGDKSFALSICEAAGLYNRPTTDQRLARLIDAWPDASDEMQCAAADIIEKSAARLRGSGGGGSD